MPALSENCHIFYRLYDGTMADVSLAECARTMTKEAIASKYGGDGTLLSTGQALYDSLDKLGGDDERLKVKDKRMVFYWQEKDGVAHVHETLAHSPAPGWDTLPAKASSGYYSCKTPDMPNAPRWPPVGTGWCQEEAATQSTLVQSMRKPAGRPPSTIWSTNKPY